MLVLRSLLAISLLVLWTLLVLHDNSSWIAISAAGALTVRALLFQNFRKCLYQMVPLLIFCAVLILMEFIFHHTISNLALKTLTGYAFFSLCVNLIPWYEISRLVNPRHRLFPCILFFLFVYHFIQALGEETMRTLTAYRLAIRHPFRRGGLPALAYSLDSLFRRCMIRAERFYIAQTLRGITE